MQRSLKPKLVIGLAALAVAALAGGAYAATQSSTPNTRQAFLNDVAKRLHVTPQGLTQALNGATLDQLQAAVKAGQLTQAEANKIEQRLKQNGTTGAIPFGFGLGPRFARPGGPGGGPGGPVGPGKNGAPGAPGRGPGGSGGGPGTPGGGPGFFGGPRGPGGGPGELQAAGTYLGLTVTQLFQQLSSGKSLAQIATAKGKTVSGLEQAMTTAAKTRLDKLVANKMITAAQEKTLLSRLSARVDQEVNQKGMSFKRPSFRGGVPRGPNAPIPPAYTPAPSAPPIA